MAIKYIPYYPDTLEGQAILDNFARTRRVLRYRDNDKVVTNIKRGMPLYEMQEVEKHGENAAGNLLVRGECLSTCAYLKDKGITVDLVYIDPPFASGADYAKKVYIRRNPKVAEAIKQAETELDNEDLRAFEEKMYGDIWDKERYLNWMYENLMAIKSVMSEEASIYVHLDYHICHYVKILMDEIFGEENFVNEIVWKKTNAHNFKTKGFVDTNDTIFFYSLNVDNFVFNDCYQGFSEAQLKRYKQDKDGRYFTGQDLTFTGNSPSRKFTWRGATPPEGRVWGMSLEDLEKAYDEGLILLRKDGVPRLDGYKVYLDEKKGSPITNIWDDIDRVGNTSSERIDYATQKPEALLERIIKASSNEGMTVADFFGGSGVTAAVANRLGRKFISGDINLNSIQTTRDRLVKDGAQFTQLEVKDGVQLYRNPVQTMDQLKKVIKGLRNEDKLDKFWEGSIVDSKNGMMPVYLPNLMDSSTRLLDIPLMNRILHEAMPDLMDQNVRRVIVYYIDITSQREIEQFIHDNNNTGIEVELRDLKQVLDEVVVADEAEWSIKENPRAIIDRWTVTINSFQSDRVRKKIAEVNEKGQQQVLQATAAGKKKDFTPITISEEGLETIEWISLDCTHSDEKAPWQSDVELKVDRLGYVSINGKPQNKFWDGTISADTTPLRMRIRNICGDETTFVL